MACRAALTRSRLSATALVRQTDNGHLAGVFAGGVGHMNLDVDFPRLNTDESDCRNM
jgi:hypothetical protein